MSSGWIQTERCAPTELSRMSRPIPAELPFRMYVEPQQQFFIRTVDGGPVPPFPSQVVEVVSVSESDCAWGLARLEVREQAGSEATRLVLAPKGLAGSIETTMRDDGETIHVRVEGGVAVDIHRTEQESYEWMEEITEENGPDLSSYICSPGHRKHCEKDLRYLLKNRGLRVAMVGPTGTGKTTYVRRLLRTALRRAREAGTPYDHAYVFNLCLGTVGTALIHGVVRNLFQAVNQAKALSDPRKGNNLVAILFDEADQLLGESQSAHEFNHERSERLAVQQLLSDEIPRIAVYMTFNDGRRCSSIPPAILARFEPRTFHRATRTAMARIAAVYASSPILKVLDVDAAHFGQVLADNLYSDERIVATVYTWSGREVSVYARDLHACSPRAVERIVTNFTRDVEDGVADGWFELYDLIDREFQAIDLKATNLHEQTFVEAWKDDSVRWVQTGHQNKTAA